MSNSFNAGQTTWNAPKLVRLGAIVDVAGTGGASNQCNPSGNGCKS